ncbi:MAG: hypothetical protein PHW13_06635 [Methylococcales bacterium]|nr:hypothetical protein [Methylococcales bacterium]
MSIKSRILSRQSFNPSLRKQVLLGAVTTLIVQSGEQIVARVAKQPLLVFGLGVMTGCLLYKNRKILLTASNKFVDAGKKGVLGQKEKVLDLIAEVHEEQ